MDEKIYFSVEEASARIPAIAKNLRILQKLKVNIEDLFGSKQQMASMIEATTHDGFHALLNSDIKLNKAFHKLLFSFYKTLDSIHSLGCIVKDVDQGLIDFYHKLGDRDVFLCWKLGEQKILHCHEIDAGFTARKRIVDMDQL